MHVHIYCWMHRSKFAALQRQWWSLNMSEIFSTGRKQQIINLPTASRNYLTQVRNELIRIVTVFLFVHQWKIVGVVLIMGSPWDPHTINSGPLIQKLLKLRNKSSCACVYFDSLYRVWSLVTSQIRRIRNDNRVTNFHFEYLCTSISLGR